MSGMVRRRWWIILQSMLVCGAVLVVLAARNDAPDFKATSLVQVRPDTESGSSVFETDLGALMAAQRQVVLSATVLDSASRSVGVMTTDLLREVTDVDVDERSGTMRITVSDQDADVAMVAANAVADSYVSQRVAKQSQQLREEADALGVQLAELEARMATLAGQGEASATALAAAKTQYDGLFNRQQDLLTRASLQTKTAEVLTQASSATQPGKKSVLGAGLLGALIGAVIGLFIALIREFFDDKVHHRQEVEKAAKLPVIAELPFDSESASSRRRSRVSLAAIDRPASPLAEAIRSLRTAVTFLSVESPIRCLTVTSGEPDEGKSLVAANLAVAYAQAGVKTILLSGDLRRPSLDARMLPQSARGFTDLIVLGRGDSLRGGMLANDLAAGVPDIVVEAHEVIYRTTIPNLSFVPAGTLPPNPAELLASKGAVTAIADLRQHCEMLIIDSPPTVVTDGVILADLADAVLLIAAVNQSHAMRIGAAVEAISGGHVRILGVVLNKLHERAVLYQPHGITTQSGSRRPKSDAASTSPAAASTAASTEVEADTRASGRPAPSSEVIDSPPLAVTGDEPAIAALEDAPTTVPEPEALFDELDVASAIEQLERDFTVGPTDPENAQPEIAESIEFDDVAGVSDDAEAAAVVVVEESAQDTEAAFAGLVALEEAASATPPERDEIDTDLIAALEDTALEGTVLEDTAPEDTVLEDTALEDTAPEDTALEETGLEDTAPEGTVLDGSEQTVATNEAVVWAVDEVEPIAEPVAEPVERPVEEHPVDDQVADDIVTDDQVTDDQVTDEQAIDERVTDEQVTGGDDVVEPAEQEAEPEHEAVAELEAETEPEPVRTAFSFPPPTTAPMTPPLDLQQVRSTVPPPPVPRGGKTPPPPPPPRSGPSSPPPPPPKRSGVGSPNEWSASEPSDVGNGVRRSAIAPLDEIEPTTQTEILERQDPALEEAQQSKSRRERERDLRRQEKEERDRQVRLGGELAKARRSMPRGFEARGEVGAEEMAKLHRALDEGTEAPAPSGPLTRAERRAAKRKAKDLRLAAKLQAKDQRRKAKAQVEKSRAEAKRAIAEAKAAKAAKDLPSSANPSYGEIADPRTGPATPPR
ncbi:MAG: polysaccharide biosynthesis tyrosine autokinase [Acidimicrobiia bacterium]